MKVTLQFAGILLAIFFTYDACTSNQGVLIPNSPAKNTETKALPNIHSVSYAKEDGVEKDGEYDGRSATLRDYIKYSDLDANTTVIYLRIGVGEKFWLDGSKTIYLYDDYGIAHICVPGGTETIRSAFNKPLRIETLHDDTDLEIGIFKNTH